MPLWNVDPVVAHAVLAVMITNVEAARRTRADRKDGRVRTMVEMTGKSGGTTAERAVDYRALPPACVRRHCRMFRAGSAPARVRLPRRMPDRLRVR